MVHIVVDPRHSVTARGSALHPQPAPGTDLALANGMLHIAVRQGYVDHAYIAARTMGFGAVGNAVRGGSCAAGGYVSRRKGCATT